MASKTKEKQDKVKDPNAIALAQIRWSKATDEEKRDNALRASKAASATAPSRLKPLSDYVCDCGAGDVIDGHRLDCKRGRVIYSRKRRGHNVYATAPNAPTNAPQTQPAQDTGTGTGTDGAAD